MRCARAVIAACLSGAAVACGSPAPLTSGGARGANILLVTIDTLRKDRVGAYGHRGGLTPALDALAAAGVRFDAAFSHVPATLPAHASILTGRTPPHHGLRVNGAARLADSVPTLATVLKARGYRTGAFVGAFVLDARYGLARGFDHYDDRYPQGTIGQTFGFAERRAAEVVAAAESWLESGGTAGPWFAWVHLFDPHAPYDAPAEYRAGRAPYDAEVAYTDAMIGRLLDRLGTTGRRATTLVAVTADHGESLGEHGEATHGLFVYDATAAVPWILAGPGVRPGVVTAPVGHADVLPTLLDLAGVPAPDGVDGLAASSDLPADRAVYLEALEAQLTRDWAPLTGLATTRWKYVALPEPELYDRSADAGESRNLAASDAARVAALEPVRASLAAGTAPAATAAPRDATAEARLRSLGYVSGTAASPRPPRRYTADDDPKRLVALNEQFTAALEAYGAGRPAEALEALLALVRARPGFATARTTAATALVAAGRAADAADLLRAAPTGTPQDADIQARLGGVLTVAGDLSGAAAALEQARRAGYTNPELLNDLGVVYARLGKADDARARFAELLAIDPDAAAAWSNLGLLELSAGRADAAAPAFRRAVESDPSRADAWQGLGAALVARDPGGAIDAWTKALALTPADFDLLYNLGMTLAASKRPAEARPHLTRFVREAPRARYARDIAQVEALLRRLP